MDNIHTVQYIDGKTLMEKIVTPAEFIIEDFWERDCISWQAHQRLESHGWYFGFVFRLPKGSLSGECQ